MAPLIDNTLNACYRFYLNNLSNGESPLNYEDYVTEVTTFLKEEQNGNNI